jgi:catechol 2,3-dioxygenase-like lactoylglutathione lyase family enzyme
MRVHHIEITVPLGREAEAKRFYIEFMGFAEIPKPESLTHRGGFWVRLDNIDLHIGIESGVERANTKVHLAYLVDEIKSWRQKIEAYGLIIKESIPIPDYDRCEFRDPFGNRVEIICPKKEPR